MYPQGGFRNPYSVYGIGDRTQTGRQPSRLSVPISQTQTQPQPQPPPQSQQPQSQQQQQQQQQPGKPELKKEESKKEEPKKEEPPKPIFPSRVITLPPTKPEAKEDPKKDEPTKPILLSQPQPQPPPQSQQQKQQLLQQQQQQPQKPELKKEEPPKQIIPSSLPPTKPEAKEEPKKEDPQKVAIPELKKEDPKPKTTLPPKEPSPPRKSVLSETAKDETMSIVPVDKPEKAIVKAGPPPAPQERSLQQGMKEDMANLTRKLAELNAGEQQKMGNSQQDLGVRVITLAGENRGATMDFGPEGRRNENVFDVRAGRKVVEDSKNEESPDKKSNRQLGANGGPISAYVNSNVQAANNSILYNSTCPHRDPGVRLQLSNAPVRSREAGTGEDKVKAIKAAKNPA